MATGRFAHGSAGEAQIGGGTVALSRAALDLLPYAVAVTNRARTIVCSNQLFDTELSRGVQDTCCDVVGCAAMGACVTEIVLDRGRPWRGATMSDSFHSTRELIATPLPPGDLVVLRFGETSPPSEGPREVAQILRVFCLGPLRIDDGSAGEVAADWMQQQPGMLLKYLLAMRHRHVRAAEIAEALWERPDVEGGHVRYVVHQLRKRLEPGSPSGTRSRYVRRDAAGYRLDLSNIWLDVDAFEATVRTGVTAVLSGDMDAGEHALLRALALYRGDFLCEDPYEEWVLRERDRLHALLVTLLRILVDARLAAGDVEQAAAHAERLALHEPLDGDLQRVSLELLLRLGRHGRALRQYEMFRKRLWRVLGVPPPFELADLIDVGR